MEDEQMPNPLVYAKKQWEKECGKAKIRWLDEVNTCYENGNKNVVEKSFRK
jgi:hypothetical protein